jgi:hypothetical protein
LEIETKNIAKTESEANQTKTIIENYKDSKFKEMEAKV